MRTYCTIILSLAFASCFRSANQKIEQKDTISEKAQVIINSSLALNKPSTKISNITRTIDSIYKLKPNKTEKISFNKNNRFEKEIEIYADDDSVISPQTNEVIPRYPLFAFDLENALSFYRHGEFSFLYFTDEKSAKSAYMKIFNLFKSNVLKTQDSISLYYDVFSKGGAWYLYSGNLIIHKYRNCSDNSAENDHENELIHYLYEGIEKSEAGFFMEYCCSCSEKLRKIAK